MSEVGLNGLKWVEMSFVLVLKLVEGGRNWLKLIKVLNIKKSRIILYN